MKKILCKAMMNQEKLELIYMNKSNQITQRKVRVIAVSKHQMKAYCYMRQQFRLFQIEQILSLAPTRKKGIA